ncbi:succinate dehydrogenase assembly factor 2 [Celerinatantimonas sp. MCCC 1A17872]|uniref:FAD assembly factor SdhE n=1 Tax=Celerinatantimonas sp. MCCC 1A17872 TaxID=3177514 RepID=UPI0038BEB7AF
MDTSLAKSRLLWACRRGMLELDVLLQPFVENCYEHLSEEQQSQFCRLLSCDDPDLFSWFMRHRPCPDEQLGKIIDAILRYNDTHSPSLSK